MVSPLGFIFWEVGYDSGREGGKEDAGSTLA